MEVLDAATNPVGAGVIDQAAALTNSFFNATMNSVLMILATELGDKTFFIAAILAMRNARLTVYAGAMGKKFILFLKIYIVLYLKLVTLMHIFFDFWSILLIISLTRCTCADALAFLCDGLCAAGAFAPHLHSLCQRGKR